MKVLVKTCLVIAVILALHTTSFSQQKPYAVTMRVLYNGRPVALPARVVIKNDKRSITLPVNAGQILVPGNMGTRSSLTFQARIGQELINIPGIPPTSLGSSWKILLADQSFGEDYKNSLPKGTVVRSACLVVFEPKDSDGTVLGVSNCRRPMKRVVHPTFGRATP